jgi:hypothetical protein
MIAKMRDDIERLKREIAKLKPASTPGIRTSVTSRGVQRQPIMKPGGGTGAGGSIIPRWG